MDITRITMTINPGEQLFVDEGGGERCVGAAKNLAHIITAMSSINHFFNSGQEVSLFEFRMFFIGKVITPDPDCGVADEESIVVKDIERVKAVIVQNAIGGLGAADLRRRVMQVAAYLSEAEYQSIILGLQEAGHLCGHEVQGQWIYTAIDNTASGFIALEYSPQFAERIIAASCEAFKEIDVDEMISQLDEMIASARLRKALKNQ